MKLKDACSLEEKGSVLKSRDVTLPTKVHIVKAMVFPVVMCECEIRRSSVEELMLSNCSAEEDP